MRVVAILASYNEERYIVGCLEYLFSQGVEAYLIDNSSTDRTPEIAERYLGRGLIGIETFPRESGTYRWRPILERKEELAATLDADWFMHADPDEIRLPPRSGITLAEAFAEVDGKGYNAVNFFEYTFVPTREEPDHDHPNFLSTMRHYYPFARSFPFQVKAWKKQPVRVALAKSGGHRVSFPNQLIYPESFKMRHYPFLSVEHALAKYLGRSYDPEELRRGWHGWRSRLAAERAQLPSQTGLNVYTSDDELDPSNPRTEHVTQSWVRLEEAPEDKRTSTPVSRTGGSAASARRDLPTSSPPSRSAARGRARRVITRLGGRAGRMRQALATRRRLAESERRILRAVGDPPDITFLTERGNLGDHLIHAGMRRLLGGLPYREVKVWPTKDGFHGLDDLGGHTALIAGGGGWCEPFHALWPKALPLIEEHFERVIVLPSTVDVSFGPVREALAKTKAIFFAREEESYRQLQGLCETEIAHDTAFFYDFAPYRGCRGKGVLRAYRTDNEAAGGPIPPGNDDISITCHTLDEFLWRIARHEAVETDRAHVMIAAAMLGKRVRYRASNYHKLPAIATHSLRGFPVERMADEGPRTAARRVASRRRADAPPSPFIVGVGRSGTTLLRLMLDAHPELAIPPETHFIPRAMRACERASNEGRNPRRAFLRALTTVETWPYHRLDEEQLRQRIETLDPFDLGGALRAFYELYAERFGKRRWGDKTPLYVRHMGMIRGLLPEARFVHVIRDGRDVALSYKGVWFGPNSVEETAERWVAWIEGARRQAQSLGESYLEVFYEDLVTDPEATLRRVCEFLELPWDPAMLRYHETASERMSEIDTDVLGPDGSLVVSGEERKAIHALTGSPPRKDRIGRWKTEMPQVDRERFESIAGGMLRELDYEIG